MENKKIKVIVHACNDLEVDVERVKIDMMNRISNPIELAKYVNFWEHRFIGKPNTMYNNICKRLKNKFIKGKNGNVKFYFSQYNWNMVIEIGYF